MTILFDTCVRTLVERCSTEWADWSPTGDQHGDHSAEFLCLLQGEAEGERVLLAQYNLGVLPALYNYLEWDTKQHQQIASLVITDAQLPNLELKAGLLRKAGWGLLRNRPETSLSLDTQNTASPELRQSAFAHPCQIKE